MVKIKILVIFGSKSDESIFKPICKGLKKNNLDYDLKIYSAHKTPDELNELMKNSYDLIIAGAGLSAALPGVIASKTIKPVIGVPCHVNYEGLDALLSVIQMPPGIAVLAVGVNKTDVVVENAVKIMQKHDSIALVGDKENEAVKKCADFLDKMGVKYEFSEKPDKEKVNIEFTYFDEPIEKKGELVIYCPLISKKDDKAEAALNLLKHSDHGLWVGLNNAKNAAIAAVQLINHDGKHNNLLNKYRADIKKRVLESN